MSWQTHVTMQWGNRYRVQIYCRASVSEAVIIKWCENLIPPIWLCFIFVFRWGWLDVVENNKIRFSVLLILRWPQKLFSCAHAWQTMTLFTIRAPEWRGLDSVNSYVFNACVVWDEVYFDPKLIYSLLTTIFCFLYLQKCQNISCTLCRIPPCSNPLMHFG